MDPSPPPAVHLDPATAAGAVSLRFERWFDERGLALPPETRAQFVEMGMQALEHWPERSSADVLDELIAELDGRLDRIVHETTARHEGFASSTEPPPGDPATAARPGGAFARLFGRRDRRH